MTQDYVLEVLAQAIETHVLYDPSGIGSRHEISSSTATV
jgi:hypothetical protein